jgi:hypothetical protein
MSALEGFREYYRGTLFLKEKFTGDIYPSTLFFPLLCYWAMPFFSGNALFCFYAVMKKAISSD